MLSNFVENDVGCHGCRLLPSFLGVNDLLNLALCCKRMLNYRMHLRHFIIQYSDGMTALKKRRLNTILGEQILPRSVVVRDFRVVPILLRWLPTQENLGAVAFTPSIRPSALNNDLIIRSIRHGDFKRVHNLGFYNLDMTNIIKVINKTNCPALRTLSLDYCHFRNPAGLGLTLAQLPRLRRLAVRHSSTSQIYNYSLVSCVALGLKVHGKRCRLMELQLTSLWTTEYDAIWLAETMEAGTFRALTRLNVGACELTNLGLTILFNTMTKDTCPALQALSLSNCGVGKEAGASLQRIITEQRLPVLSRWKSV